MTADYAETQNGQRPSPYRPTDPPDVPFGAGPTQVVPFAWAEWMLTTMREDELAGRKPRPFSVLLAAAAMAAR